MSRDRDSGDLLRISSRLIQIWYEMSRDRSSLQTSRGEEFG